jgi:tetratricopeptide (TPR) repeat protein
MLNKINIRHDRQKLIVYVFLTLVTLAVFCQVTQYEFVNFDDQMYVTQNSHIQSGITLDGLRWSFSTTYFEFWHPLTWLSLMLDYQLYGLNAGGYHLTNLILHIMSALLLFWLFNRMTGAIWRSAFVAVLFVLHPLRVESVAWVAERKDVLSMFFGLASIYAYTYYVESSKFSKYLLCLILFALSLMAKSMLVTLPFVLLLLDYWPLGRWPRALKNEGKLCNVYHLEKDISVPIKSRSQLIGRLLWEKAPFIFLTIVSSILTFWSQNKGGAVVAMEYLPFPARVSNAIISYASYLGKIFWPVDLAVFYPYEYSFPLWQILASCFILIGITIAVIYFLKKLPFLFIGWFWYLGTLIPVIGLVQVGMQAMADRYTYLPSIGIAIMLAWGIPLLFPREDMRKKILFPAGIAFLAVMAFLTWRQCGYWKNSISLSSHALKVTKNNYMAYNNRGSAYAGLGQYQLAIEDLNKSILLKPNYNLAYCNRGIAYNGLGQYLLAIEDFNKAVRLKPDFASTYYSRGTVYSELGQYQRAIEDFNKVIRLESNYVDAYNNRGNAYDKLGQQQLAIEDFNKAIRLKPDDAKAYYNRGNAYAKLGQYQRAIEDFSKAIRLESNYVDAYNNRGNAYDKLGRQQLAIDDFNKAIRLKPDDAKVYYNRGNAYAKLGQKQPAIEDFNKAIRLKSDYVPAYYSRGTIYGELGQYQRAIEDFNKAIRLKPDYVDAYYNRGTAYAMLGQYQLAIEDYSKTIRLKPDYADAYNNRGFVYLNQSNNKLGCLDAQKACELGNCKTLEAVNTGGLCR